jgi:hypothetical protein
MGGWTNVHDEDQSVQPSVVSDDLVQVLTKKFVKDGTSQFPNIHVNFHKFHILFSMRLSQLDLDMTRFAKGGFWKCSWVCTECREWLLLVLTFLERYHQHGDEFLNHIIQVQVMKPGFHLWMLKPKSSQNSGSTHIHQTSWKILNKRLSARELMATVFWHRKGMMMVEFMQHGTIIRSEVYR